MKYLIILLALTSCAKEKLVYKYQYTTEESAKYNRINSHLGDYKHMNASEIEAERIHQRSLVTRSKVITDTLYIFNN